MRKYPDRDRAIFKVLRACRGQSATDAVEGTPVSAQTLRNWRNEKTRYPRHVTLEAVANAHGMRFVLVDADEAAEIKRQAEARAT